MSAQLGDLRSVGLLLELCQDCAQGGITGAMEGAGITLPAMSSSCGRQQIHRTVITPFAVPLPPSFAHRSNVEKRTASATLVPLAAFPYK